MLRHPTLAKLDELRLTGMAKALEEQLQVTAPYAEMSFEERLGLLVDREALERTNRRLEYRLRRAKLRQAAAVEDLDFRHPRGLDKRLMRSLIECRWIAEHHNLLLTGPTGTGKTYIACALAHKACREGYTALYARCSTLLRELELARADGRYGKLLGRMAKTDLLLLDDWGLPSLPTYGETMQPPELRNPRARGEAPYARDEAGERFGRARSSGPAAGGSRRRPEAAGPRDLGAQSPAHRASASAQVHGGVQARDRPRGGRVHGAG